MGLVFSIFEIAAFGRLLETPVYERNDDGKRFLRYSAAFSAED